MTADEQGGTQPQDEKTSPEASRDQRAATAVADEPATREPEPTEPPAGTPVETAGRATREEPDPSREPTAAAGAGGDESGAGGADELGDAASVAAKVEDAVAAGEGAAAEVAPAGAEAAATGETDTSGEPHAASEQGAPSGEAATSVEAAAAEAQVPASGGVVTGEAAHDETAAASRAPESAAGAATAAVDTPPAEGSETAAPAEPEAPPRDLGPEPTTMEELLSEQTGDIKSFKHGDVVEGSVVRIDKDEILVDIGAKSEGVVSNRELYGRNAESQPVLNIGDTVLVYVLQPESNEGHAVLSLRRAGLERKWRSMQEQFEAGVIIEAPVIDHNKGGLIVDCGIRGFVPISQIVDFPRRPQNDQPRDAAQEIAEKLQPFVGRKLRLKILEVNRKANRLILSEKVALYEERREKRDELFSSLQVGQKVTGTVRSIAPFGVFVDLGGIDGLVHKSELSWNKVNNPEAGYKVGEEVEAEVIDINHERGRISLSIRRLQPDPWHSTVADFKVGDVIDGTVTKIVNFGAFVRVRDGLEGLIHISELSHQRVAHPGDVVHEGQNLKLKIISLDSERHRLGLSLKQAEEPVARPAAADAPRERRPRQERSYDAAQAVQEPEGGIDNTLAAAFAQVRQQMAETEQARAGAEPADSAGTSPAATAEARPDAAETPTADVQTPAKAEAAAATPIAEAEAPTAEAEPATDTRSEAEVAAELSAATVDEDAAAAETDDAPALKVAPAKDAKPGKASKAAAQSSAEAAPAPSTETTPEADATVEPTPEPESAGQPEEPARAEEARQSEPAPEPEAAAEESAGTDEAPADAAAATDETSATVEESGSTDEAATGSATSDEAPPSGEVPARGGEDDKGSPVD